MTTFELTQEGLLEARESKRLGILTGDTSLPIRVKRPDLKAALAYYWGRGIPLDPSHLKWDINKERTH